MSDDSFHRTTVLCERLLSMSPQRMLAVHGKVQSPPPQIFNRNKISSNILCLEIQPHCKEITFEIEVKTWDPSDLDNFSVIINADCDVMIFCCS